MDVTKLGGRHPEVTIVAGVHGEEASGVQAIERFLDDPPDIHSPVQFIVANEEALETGERCIDADLNRSFPGNPESTDHEVALAHRLLKQVRDTKVLDLHATYATDKPVVFCSHFTLSTLHLIRSTGIDIVVDPQPISTGALVSHCTGVVVECGPMGEPGTVDTAYEVLRNFLAANDVIDAPFEYSVDPQVFRPFERIEYPPEDADLHATDFEVVREGEIFLTVDGDDIAAEQDFYPILTTDNGDDPKPFVGGKAKNEGTVSDRLFQNS